MDKSFTIDKGKTHFFLTFFICLITGWLVQTNPVNAQMYYVSGDTLWVQESADADPVFIADGTTNPIYAVEADVDNGYLYWSQEASFDTEIYRTSLDDFTSEMLVDAGGSVRGIALDTENGKIYWADLQNSGAIERANLDGTEIETLVSGETTEGTLDIALDIANGKMYWVKTGAVMRANMDGSEVETVAEMASYIQPQGITLDTGNGFVYWSDTSSDEILRAPVSGGDSETFVDADSPSALELDADAQKLYWIEDYTFSGNGGAIYRSDLDGSNVEIVMELSWTRSALAVSGWGSAVSAERETEMPSSVKLYDNYPNPFNPSTVISYQLPVSSEVSLKVFDMLGREVATLVDGNVPAGEHNVQFDAAGLSSGMYFYRLTVGDKIQTGKMTLLK
ncbi:T9SS type A sorting domain-containing protein [Gracilimonas mengyeensis]|uniref:Por secretion system C-terminal sorting domain-containing protein n=1 Tax=Gracilimonas mengyeensis TaxID=1302730 RepID=A0A521F516_9BACT|nr:T9SS type A sorting domain-containing protein [Gracilimonas mengyeensis]SMO91272.1 Por secretion system C-terminal sorting domain-containing protein [Gracilimonas mengyeensis]